MTENDRELLIWAAKAAGISIDLGVKVKSGHLLVIYKGITPFWNPLVNYGDALMLAEKLNLCLDMRGSEAWVGRYPIELGNNGVDDADVRRAIVLVAAEIGRNMK